MKVQVSLISVNYKVKKELIACISSIVMSKPKVSYEIIVVDNEEKSEIEEVLKNKYPKVKYIKSSENVGYGAGNNLGVKHALGKFIFFINPDTVITKDAIDTLYNFVNKDPNAGMVAPLLLNPSGKIYPSQGSDEYSLVSALVVISFINKIFPSNPISRKFFHKDWNKKDVEEFDVVPGTAFIIRKSIFERVKMFDEKFFLYFEEYDLAKRVKKLGYKNFIIPNAKVYHIWEASTKKRKDIDEIFSKSRYLFFKKNYGILTALIVNISSGFGKFEFILSLIIAAFVFLRLFKIGELMPFIGDQGWFYLSARDMVFKGEIPLVGITSSHPWLHQGPLWTYMLAGIFWLFGFNPVNGAYLTIVLGIFTVLLIYIVGSEMFSKKIAIIAALLYGTSPLAIIYSRTPYHTSPIPLVTLLFIFSVYKFIRGNKKFLPLSILFLSILYNLELATVVLWLVLFIVLGYGLWKKKEWVKKIFDKKNIIYSFLAFLIPMIPILVYDFNNNFPQTLKFIAWIGYRISIFFGFPSIHPEKDLVSLSSMLLFSFQFYQTLIFAANSIVSLIIFLFSFCVLFFNLYKLFIKKIKNVGLIILFLWISVSLVGYIVNKSSSEAYLPILFPALIYLVAFSFSKIMNIRILFIPVVFLVVLLSCINSYFIISKNYFVNNKLNFTNRLLISAEIVKKSEGRGYNIVGNGNGSQFESFTMNYEYLTWWLGHPPSKSSEKLKFIIEENEKGLFLIKNE